jgi:ssDNA-binding replication factor A large subunit
MIIEKISKLSNISKEEIERKIEAKRAKLSGLISREGAAQVIAAELGISFDNEKLKIEELLSGMRKVNTFGKVIKVEFCN